MSRRRGWGYYLMAPARWLSELFRIVVLIPYYETLRAFGQVGRWFTGGTGRRSWAGIFSFYLLWLPLTIWHLITSMFRGIWRAIVTWPRIMRLRDLATGLPALLVAVPAVLAMSMLRKDRNELTGMYQKGMNDSYVAAAKETDPAAQKTEMESALFYARSLARIDPEDRMYRFNLALLYIGAGDNARGQTMMAEMAPRDRTGFGPAHFWTAKQILMKPLTDQAFVLAASHLERALERSLDGDAVDESEVRKLLGQVYFQNYLLAVNDKRNPLNITPEAALHEVWVHLKDYKGKDQNVSYMLGTVLVLQKKLEEARMVMQGVVEPLAEKVRFNGDDIVARIELARALLVVGDFTEATNVLQTGRNRTPDARLDHALSNVHFKRAEFIRQNLPNATELSFEELQKSFELDADSGSVVARYLQGLCDSPEEQALTRKSLASLSPAVRNRGVTKFLLGFDAERRGVPQLADQFYGEAVKSNDPETPSIVAEVAFAVFEKRYRAIKTDDGLRIVQRGLLLWPNHPDLLYVRAFQFRQTSQTSNALALLKKAVEAREKNVTLKLRIAQDARLYGDLATIYEDLSQQENAGKYRRLAESAVAKRESLK